MKEHVKDTNCAPEFLCIDCKYHEDLSYGFDEHDSDFGWKCINQKSEFYDMYFYPTDKDYWDDWHDKLQICKDYSEDL